MKVTQIGPDSFDVYDWTMIDMSIYEWMAYWYERGSYDGNGIAIAKRRDGLFDWFDLSHCSCYGPLEKTMKETGISPQLMWDRFTTDSCLDRKRTPKDHDYKWWNSLWMELSNWPEFMEKRPSGIDLYWGRELYDGKPE